MFQPMRARCITSVVFAITGLIALGPPAAAADSSDRRSDPDDVRFLVRSPTLRRFSRSNNSSRPRYRKVLLLLKLETVPSRVAHRGFTGRGHRRGRQDLRMADLQHACPSSWHTTSLVATAAAIPPGRTDDADYEAWVNAIAVTIAERRAIVILEPDAIRSSRAIAGTTRLASSQRIATRSSTTPSEPRRVAENACLLGCGQQSLAGSRHDRKPPGEGGPRSVRGFSLKRVERPADGGIGQIRHMGW